MGMLPTPGLACGRLRKANRLATIFDGGYFRILCEIL